MLRRGRNHPAMEQSLGRLMASVSGINVPQFGSFQPVVPYRYANSMTTSTVDAEFGEYVCVQNPPVFPTISILGRLTEINEAVRSVLERPPAPSIPQPDSELSSVCPLSYVPITCPARGEFCLHEQCFDLRSFLMLQDESNWVCPVCKLPLTWSSLRFDPSFMKSIASRQLSRQVSVPEATHEEFEVTSFESTDFDDFF